MGKTKKCPRCGSSMELREGRYGKFYGCLDYPYCKGSRGYGSESYSSSSGYRDFGDCLHNPRCGQFYEYDDEPF